MKHAFAKTGVVILALVVIGVFGWMWYQKMQKPLEGSPEQIVLLDWVDRGIKPEDMAVQEQKIADLQAQIAQKEAAGERDSHLILLLGNAYYTIGELKKAAEHYLDILSTHPNDPATLENLGQVQLERGDYAGAEASWRAALSINPYEVTYLRLADLIAEHFPDRQVEVRTLLEDAIATLGQTAGLLARLGQWYADNGMYDEAISHYEVALQLNPDHQGIKDEIERLKGLRSDVVK